MRPQLVESLAQGIAGTIGVGFGPEEGEKLVPTPEPAGESDGEIEEEGEPLGLNQKRGER
jgi:hypothetical protein